MEKVVIVNKKDQVLGEAERDVAHQVRGILHRGFIILIFNSKGQLLVLKRSKEKKLCPLFWDGCCSHPKKGETYVQAGERRLKEELGFTAPLKSIDEFYYRAIDANRGSEEEICAVLEGQFDGKIRPNGQEVADYRWIGLEKLSQEIKANPDDFAPWFKKTVSLFLRQGK